MTDLMNMSHAGHAAAYPASSTPRHHQKNKKNAAVNAQPSLMLIGAE